ncbi:hypothetical protein O7627_33590 [Solwaraspora sp. WMMD1047]|uniref:hypothetical protein n=1 Tax=Solwaraspora sp. WMMD1047 TaxID=3016102 RepID=UPI002416F5D5|nr:hypothetical protein [Solwaraspora sp. WMMD1047]MDG4834200.1 hypothetical protein [Solwaraspora sp. WMMD1047]
MSEGPGTHTPPWTPPSPGELLTRAAVKSDANLADVEGVLNDTGVRIPSPVPGQRHIQARRLRVEGTKKTGETFSIDQHFTPGVWAILHPRNSAGKTSMLEYLVWALRGRPRDLTPDVSAWMRRIRVDATVGGQHVRVALDQDTTRARPHLAGRLLSANSPDSLVAAMDGEMPVLASADEEQVDRLIGTFMMESLGLDYTSVWNPSGGLDGQGSAQAHGWPAYFGACYLNPGGDKLLLGDVSASASLSARLMELFIGIPYASVLTHLSALRKRYTKETNQAIQRASQDRTARQAEREQWQRELDDVTRRMTAAQQSTNPRTEAALAAVDVALADLRTARQAHTIAEDDHRGADTGLLIAEQRVMDAKETWQARQVLGRLSPTCCPRCEAPIEPDRHASEREDASCAVCTRPMPAVDAELAEAQIEELEQQLAAQRATRQQTADKLKERAAQLHAAQQRYENAVSRLNEIAVAPAYRTLRELEIEAARLEGQLRVTGSADGGGRAPTEQRRERILTAVHAVVEAAVKEAAERLFPDLNREVVDLARSFGVANLDSVDVKRNGHLNAVKDGEHTPFGEFSRGERLRMRIAMVIAMLRVSTQRGAAAHPGLLLIDAVGSEEVNTEPGRLLITELHRLAGELPGLQIILTTATPALVEGILPAERIITTEKDHMF